MLLLIWAADLAIVAAAEQLGLGAIAPHFCGRVHQFARDLLQKLTADSTHHAGLSGALRQSARALLGADTNRRLARLAMLLDDASSTDTESD